VPPDQIISIVAVIAVVLLAIAFPKLYTLFMRYIGVPMSGWRRAYPADPPLIETEIAAMPPHAAAHFSRAARQLVPLGFTAAANLRAPAHVPGADGYVSLWLHPRDGASVQLIAFFIAARDDLPAREGQVVTFLTEFAGDDDSRGGVVTSNTIEVSVFASHPAWDALRWPGMRDLAALYRLHAFRADRAGPPAERKLPDQPVDYLRQQNLEILWRQVEAGYFWFDADSNVFRRRLKGTFLMTWKLLWPLRPLADRRNERKLRRDLRAAGMPPPEDHRPQPPDEPPSESPLSYRRPAMDDGIDEVDDETEGTSAPPS
jgi:hypothetical protein